MTGHEITEFYDAGTPAARLAAAAARGDTAEVAMLVRAGADPNAPGRDGMLPLTWAFLAGTEAGVRALLAAGANPSRRNGVFSPASSGVEGVPPIGLAVGAPDRRWLALFLAHGGDPNAPGLTGEPLIFAAIGTRDLPRVRLLVERGADVNALGLARLTPLTAAAAQNQFHIVRYLLERGADWRPDTGAGTLAFLVQESTVDPEFRELFDAHRWVRTFLEMRGVRFPVPDPAEQNTAQLGTAAYVPSPER